MGSRVILLCLVLTRVSGNDDLFYKTGIKSGDQKDAASENIGFTQPLDFSFSAQFFGHGDNVFRPEPQVQSGVFDFFGAESKNSPKLPESVARMAFPARAHHNAYAKPPFSTFARGPDASEIYNVKTVKSVPPPPKRDVSNPAPKSEQLRGKSSYPAPYGGSKSDHAPRFKSSPVFANSEDIEIFYPPGRTLLPQLHHGRPRPYDGYRSVADSMSLMNDEEEHVYTPAKRHYPSGYPRHRPSFDDRRPQRFNAEVAESRNEEREAEEESEEDEDRNSGYRYQFDDSIEVPDLVIKRYPYERHVYDDSEFTRDYDKYTKSLDSDLEKRYGVPDFKFEQYKEEPSEDLARNSNCEKVESEDGSNTCYVCRNPKTGAKYEQCSYEKQPTNKKYSYKSENYSKKKPSPAKYRYKRSSDAELEYADDTIEENYGSDYGKRKSKKFSNVAEKKVPKRRPRQNDEGPTSSYNGPDYTYEGPRYSYEGPSSPYEGPRHSYEGPVHDYEGPDHDDYYDKTDVRIRFDDDSGSFDEGSSSRYQQSPKAEVEEFKPTRGSSGDYRFGPEFFEDEGVKFEKRKQKPRKKVEKIVEEVDEDAQAGKVKVFKNGDVCEKVRRKNLICMVCNNDKTQAKYEQCQYSKKPTSQGYTYGSEKSYSSKKPKNSRPERHVNQDPEISESKFIYTKVEHQVFGDDDGETTIIRRQRNAPQAEEKVVGELEGVEENRRSYSYDDDGEYPDLAGIVDNLGGGSEDVKSFQDTPGGPTYQLLGETQGTSKNKLFPQSNETFEQYFSRVFPQFEVFGKLSPSVLGPVADLETLSGLPGLQEKMKMVPGSPTPAPSEGMKDLKMLAQTLENFHTKDWSKCSKKEFPKMVCYECPTPEGIIHEECMFIENKVQPTANPSDESTAANILTAVQSAILSGHMEDSVKPGERFKGDFGGTGGTTEVEQFGERKRGKKRKKINWRAQQQQQQQQQQQEPSEVEEVIWDGGETEDGSAESGIKIFFNSTIDLGKSR